MNATLEKAFDEAAKLPEDEQEHFALRLLDELELRKALAEAEEDVKHGRVVPIEEVKKMIPQWIAESSSQKRRSAT
jgi:predicted transcriptional regulator